MRGVEVMKMMHCVLVVFLAIALLATTAPPVALAAPKRGGTLTIIIAEEVRHLDIIFDGGTEGRYVNNQVTDGLVNTDRSGKIVPALAESWTVSTDGTVYTFKLRPGVKFSSGNPLTAQDVRFSLRRLKNLKDQPIGIAFKKVQEAYDVLSDDKKRAMYDQYGFYSENFREPPPGSDPGFGGSAV